MEARTDYSSNVFQRPAFAAPNGPIKDNLGRLLPLRLQPIERLVLVRPFPPALKDDRLLDERRRLVLVPEGGDVVCLLDERLEGVHA